MFRLGLLVCLVATAAAVPVESDTEFCNGISECPPDCGYVSRNEKCVFCRCGDSPLVMRPGPLPTPEPEPQCEYGPGIIDECDNDCQCIKGGRYGCTRKLCMPGQTPEKPKTCTGPEGLPKRAGQIVFCHEGIIKTQREGSKCPTGAVRKDDEDCNTCTCVGNGVWACTLKACIRDEPQCEYGPGIIDECDNDCQCIKGGRYGCTRKLCMPGQTPEKPKTCTGPEGLPKRAGQVVSCHDGIIKVQNKDDKCLAGAVRLDDEDCNTCTCMGAGGWACTLKLCFTEIEEQQLEGCPYGPGFIDECNNDCNCVDGRFYGCTRKACKPGERSEVPMKCSNADNLPSRTGQRVLCDEGIVKLQKKEAGCDHGPGFIDECNNDCNCVDGRFYGCTRKACKPGERSEVPMKCTESDKLPSRKGQRVYCNEGIVKLEQPVCPHGEEFIDECGRECRCLENGYACTGPACEQGKIGMKPMACEDPLKLPQRKGRRVFCHEKIVKVQDESAPCLPGSSFALECNTCFCSDNGQSGCTLKLCLGEPSASTRTCENNLPECPQDCGKEYNSGLDCFNCLCGVGNPGDVTVQLGEECPPGTILSDSGAFFKTCGPSDKCTHGLEFIDECDNDCRCMADGYACTRKACRSGQTSEKPQTCQGTAQLPTRQGKRVFCHEGIIKTQHIDDGCIPGSVFNDDCNNCFCGSNQQAGCTLKLCPTEKPDSCQHGPSFIDECGNDCSCSKGDYGCTFKACKPGEIPQKPMTCDGAADLPKRTGMRVMCHEGIVKTQPISEKCLPGSVYMDECNTCTCGPTGVGGCTFKACL